MSLIKLLSTLGEIYVGPCSYMAVQDAAKVATTRMLMSIPSFRPFQVRSDCLLSSWHRTGEPSVNFGRWTGRSMSKTSEGD
jgi:hypothetical protein